MYYFKNYFFGHTGFHERPFLIFRIEFYDTGIPESSIEQY